MVATLERTKRKITVQPRYVVDDAADLKLAMEQRSSAEFINNDKFDAFLDVDQDPYYINEDEDFGCIVGCALTDTLQEIISSLVGGYSVLKFFEGGKSDPDKEKLSVWEKRGEEIFALRKYYFGNGSHTYNDIRRWIEMYSTELKELDNLRKQYD